MGLISILAAAAAAFAFGAAWYMALSKPWIRAAGIAVDDKGRPQGNGSPLPFVLSGIATPVSGITAGLGIGAFFITPWIMINNAYGMRPALLTVIDGGYAIFGCALIGLVLTLL